MKRSLVALFLVIVAMTLSGVAQTTTPAPEPKSETADQSPTDKSPHTEMLSSPANAPTATDPLLEPPRLPQSNNSLIGGFATKVDGLRNRIVLEPFGSGKKITVGFDERSHIFRDGRETTILGIRTGDRIYVDTMQLNGRVFAKNIRVFTATGTAEAQGQIVGINGNAVQLADRLTRRTVKLSLAPTTRIQMKSSEASKADLKPGALVDVIFAPGANGGTAQQISILATPGQVYLFAGRITFLDIRNGLLALQNESDGKSYDIHFNPAATGNGEELGLGAEIAASTSFDGSRYVANQLKITAPAGTAKTADQ